MRIFKMSFITMIFVSCLTFVTAHAGRYIQLNGVSIPNSLSSTGYEYGTLEKNMNSSQYLNNTNDYKVKAKIYGMGINGSNDWSPTWNTVSASSWGELGNLGDGSANPYQYGLNSGTSNKIRIKSNSLLGHTFWGMWITDQDLYEMNQ